MYLYLLLYARVYECVLLVRARSCTCAQAYIQNIVFNLDCGEKPILQNFQLSLQISHLNMSYITNIINKLEDYTYKPLEVHVLFYLIRIDI